LTPETSVGFRQIRFARDVLGRPLLPWQEFAAIHAGEILSDGRPRFRIVLVIVARQNGKTELPAVLAPYWMYVDEWPLVLGTSTKLEYAKDTWDKSRHLIRKCDALPTDTRWFVRGNNLTDMWTPGEESHYRIAAANEEGGRSLTVNRAVADELRQHHDYTAWNAMEPAASPEDAQIWALSNAGDDRSTVLNDHRDTAIAMVKWVDEVGVEHAAELIAAGQCPHDWRLGILEWSAPEDADPEDVPALLQANPRVGYGRNLEDLLLEARRAKAKGGEALTGFKTEKMCINVPRLKPAIDLNAWRASRDPGTLTAVRQRVVLCVDVSLDGHHATAVVAATLPGGKIRVEVVAAWDSAFAMQVGLPDLVEKIKPRGVGWFPNGPAAAVAAALADRNKAGEARRPWPPRSVTVEAIQREMPAVCMGLAKDVLAGQVLHSGDPLLNDQVEAAEKHERPGGTWVFARGDEGHVDAVYAMARAVHLARTLPAPVGGLRLIGPSTS
jgi:phage terminase large subunit-like protein